MKEKEFERLSLLKEEENKLYDKNIQYVCGIDEAGRGSVLGPMVIAGVLVPEKMESRTSRKAGEQLKKA